MKQGHPRHVGRALSGCSRKRGRLLTSKLLCVSHEQSSAVSRSPLKIFPASDREKQSWSSFFFGNRTASKDDFFLTDIGRTTPHFFFTQTEGKKATPQTNYILAFIVVTWKQLPPSHMNIPASINTHTWSSEFLCLHLLKDVKW